MLRSNNSEFAKACERLEARIEGIPVLNGNESCRSCLFRVRVELSPHHSEQEKRQMLAGCSGMETTADITDDPSAYCGAARDLQLAMEGMHRVIDGNLVERVTDLSHVEGVDQVEHMFFLGDKRIFASRETPLGQLANPVLDMRQYTNRATNQPLTSRQVYTSDKMLANIVP